MIYRISDNRPNICAQPLVVMALSLFENNRDALTGYSMFAKKAANLFKQELSAFIVVELSLISASYLLPVRVKRLLFRDKGE